MKTKLIYGLIIACLVTVSGVLYLQDSKEAPVTISVQESDAKTVKTVLAEEPTIVVYVTGAVNKPDVYEVKEHSRLHEVVDQAGGFKASADKEYLNLARFVFDGEMIHVPQLGETSESSEFEEGDYSEKVSINQASVQELMSLTGIGATKAEAIVDYRQSNGPFQRIEDIMKVNGIKDAMYNKIKDDIVI